MSRAAVLGHDEIGPAVSVQVGHGQPASDDRHEEARARLGRSVGELARAEAAIEERRLAIGHRGLNALDRRLDVTVDADEVQNAVEVEVREGDAERERKKRRPPDSALDGFVHEEVALGAGREHGPHLVREVADHEGRAAVVLRVPERDPHRAARAAVLSHGNAGFDGHVAKNGDAVHGLFVPVQVVGRRVVRDDQVHAAVAVDVADGHAQRLAERVREAGFFRDVLELPVPEALVEAGRDAVVALGRAVGLRLSVQRAVHVRLQRPIHVLADEEVEHSVAVEVGEGRGRAPAGSHETRALRRVMETALAVVEKETDVIDARDDDVGEPVVIHVTDGHAHAIERNGEAGVARAVLEPDRSPRLGHVLPEGKGGLLRGLRVSRPVAAVDEEKVDAAIAVGVERRDAGAHGLGHPLLACGTVDVNEGHARGLRDVLEPDRRGDFRRLRGGRGGDGRGRRLAAGSEEEEGRGERERKISLNGHRRANATRSCDAPIHRRVRE